MRTTLTLDSEVAERLRQEAALGHKTFKEIVNSALRRGLGLEAPPPRTAFRVQPHSSAFLPGIDPGKLNHLLDELEAAAFIAKKPAK